MAFTYGTFHFAHKTSPALEKIRQICIEEESF